MVELLQTLQRIQTVAHGNVLIMGDFNFPHIQWEDGFVEGSAESEAAQFFDVTQDLLLHQHVTCNTRFREGNAPSRLDLLFSNKDHLVEELQTSQPLGKSDHIVLSWKCIYEQEHSKDRTRTDREGRFDFRKGKYKEMSERLGKIDWTILEDMEVQAVWNYIQQSLLESIKLFVPSARRKRKGKLTPWWNNELKKQVKRKHKTWKDYVRTREPDEYKAYVHQRNLTTKMIRKAKAEYEATLVQKIKTEPQKLHRYIRSQLKVRAMVGPLEMESGCLTENDSEVAETLNTFFKSVFVDEDTSHIPEFQLHTDVVPTEMVDIDITIQDVLTELKKLDSNKAAGPDGLPSMVLKACADVLALPLLILFKKSLDTGELPREWKQAIITPIFKKGSKTKPGNYRPVSLTSQCCKIFERILRKYIVAHLEDNHCISTHQHGFMKKRSCQTNLLETFEDWTQLIDEGAGMDVVFLDYQKAFDTVPHTRLNRKLRGYGVTGKVLNWISEFLRERTQRVSVNNHLSSWTKVISGVPQGSVLGPLLFIVYVNELPDLISNKMKMYADDTKLYGPATKQDEVESMQKDINTLTDWSKDWLLKFNIDKCKIMHCGTQNHHAIYYMKQPNGETKQLIETEVEKDLGVHVTKTLKPTLHCSKAANKAMSALKLLKMTFGHLTTHNFKILYSVYIRPHLEHCIQAVGPYMVQDFKTLEKVQRRATKLVKGLNSTSYEERLELLDLTTFEERVRRGDLIETHKILKNHLDIGASQFFERTQDTKTRGHNLKLKKTRVKSKARSKFFSNRVVTAWNKLPNEVVMANSTNEFKNRLDRFRTETTLSSLFQVTQ